MCGRYYIPEEDVAEELQAIIDEIQRRGSKIKLKRSEIFPTDIVPVLANNRSMIVKPFAMTWGYKYPNGDGKPIINARSESASVKPMFKDGMLQRRCLIPAAHYFEWEKRDGKRIKYAIGPKNTEVLYMAGIYHLEKGVPAFTILTREVAPCIAFIHNRMPVILSDDMQKEWMNVKNDANDVLRSSNLDMEYHAV